MCWVAELTFLWQVCFRWACQGLVCGHSDKTSTCWALARGAFDGFVQAGTARCLWRAGEPWRAARSPREQVLSHGSCSSLQQVPCALALGQERPKGVAVNLSLGISETSPAMSCCQEPGASSLHSQFQL